MSGKKKVIVPIVFVMLLIILISGTTYAIYTWATKEIIDGSTECFKVNYIKGQDIGSENEHKVLMPSADYTEGLYATVIVSMNSSCISNGTGTLYLNTDATTSNILLSSGALKYQVIENSLTLGSSGTISSTGQLTIKENFEVTTTPKQYTVIVWLDGSIITDDNASQILSSTYKGSISMKIESGDL